MTLEDSMLLKKISILDSIIDKYTYWLIPGFTPITKGARFILERLAKMIIGNGMSV